MKKKKATKDDEGKPRMDLLDPYWLEDTADVLRQGAKIHGDYNWRGLEQARIIASTLRHITAIMRGEIIDQGTGKPHAACLTCNAMFLHYFTRIQDDNTKISRHGSETYTYDGRTYESD